MYNSCNYRLHSQGIIEVKGIRTKVAVKNLFEILLNQTEIRLYLPIPD